MTRVADPLSPASWPEPLQQAFAKLPPVTWTVALSGGLDSVLLLHLALAWQREGDEQPRVRAIHVNHGLQSQSNTWALACQQICDELGVAVEIVPVAVQGDSGKGLEDAAREARYAAFSQHLRPEEALLVGHHADDQAETQLYRMMRGAGLAGFAAMPESRPLGSGRLYRPLLSQTRQSLEKRARDAGLVWIEDPSNTDERYDRNYLRNRVMVLLKQRWPDVGERMARNARHGREALQLLDERAADDAAEVLEPDSCDCHLKPLRQLSGPRQRNFVQWWLRRAGLPPLAEKQLLHALPEFLESDDDGLAEICWAGLVLRRYNGRAMVLNQHVLTYRPEPSLWRPPESLEWGGGLVITERALGGGFCTGDAELTVRPRLGGEQVELASGQHQPLKKWLQGARIPPWERAALPLIWAGNALVAVGDLWIHPRYRATAGQEGWLVHWCSPPFRAMATYPQDPVVFPLSD